MHFEKKNNKSRQIRSFIILVLFTFYTPLFSQISTTKHDTTLRITRGSYIRYKENKSFIQKDTSITLSGTLFPADRKGAEKTITFYDSLRSKASKTLLTRVLYDLVIVSPDSTDLKKITNNSQENFNEFIGKRIRNIQMQRLNVFGADLKNPDYYKPRGIEKVLNGTHVNTNEKILRKYLLFSEGDSLSPLLLSDNERIIRQLPYIDDARIVVVPVSDEEVDIIVITKDVYSLGGNFDYISKKKGTISMFEKNIFGMGHAFELEVPYSADSHDSPGIGLKYDVNNILKSFINLDLYYRNGLGEKTYGINLSKSLLSSTTKYGGGITIRNTFTTEDLDTLISPHPLKYNYQDYWLQRSFLVDKQSVTRIITGVRYTNNNIFERPLIDPESFHSLQKYKTLIGTAAISIQKYYKTNLIYSYGRTEDIPYGMMIELHSGIEINEFQNRAYAGIDLAYGFSSKSMGYFYTSAGFGTFVKNNRTDQGTLRINMNYFSNLLYLGDLKIRNFVKINYTRGFDRYNDEYLKITKNNGFAGFANDSLRGSQRVIMGIESVVFNPLNIYGFRFAFFGFTDLAFLAGTNQMINKGSFLSGVGLGIRLRNDNLIFNTFQIKLGFFPNPPQYSRINNFIVSGEQLLRPDNFDPGPPSVITYR